MEPTKNSALLIEEDSNAGAAVRARLAYQEQIERHGYAVAQAYQDELGVLIRAQERDPRCPSDEDVQTERRQLASWWALMGRLGLARYQVICSRC